MYRYEVDLSLFISGYPQISPTKGWYQQLVADEVEAQAVVKAEVVRKHLLVVVGRESSE